MIYYIGLGSNVGDRLQNLLNAKKGLSALGDVQKQSSVYETPAWGKTDQASFYNAVVRLHSIHRPFRLLRKLKTLEIQGGRSFGERWGPRVIDLDILWWDGSAIHTPILTVPHPFLQERAFVLQPLAEIDPDLKLTSGLTVQAHLKRYFPQTHFVKITETW